MKRFSITNAEAKDYAEWYKAYHLSNIPTDLESYLSVLKKQEPVLITEDGVEIDEGESCWMVYSTFEIGCWSDVKAVGVSKHCKYFSTEQWAREWVLFNKPVLCLADIQECLIFLPKSDLMNTLVPLAHSRVFPQK